MSPFLFAQDNPDLSSGCNLVFTFGKPSRVFWSTGGFRIIPFSVSAQYLMLGNDSLVNVVQLLSHVRLFVTPWTSCTPGSSALHCLSQSLLRFMSISPFAFNLSQHQDLFQWVSFSNQVAKCWSFSFSNSPSKKYSGFISLRIDWFDLLAVRGTLQGLLQHHNSKASVL